MAAYKNLLLLFLLLFSLFSSALVAQIKVPPAPQPARYMVDFANMLTPAEAQSIEDKLYGYFKAKQTQIVIVTVGSLDGNTVEAYAEALFNQWGIGNKERKDGLLLLISKNDRKMRIEVGYGLEGTITDAFAAEVINVSLKTNFKNNDFYAGIDAATQKIIGKLTPNYNILPTTVDTIRATNKQKEEAARRELSRQKQIKESLKKEEIAARNWFGLKIFGIISLLVIGGFFGLRWQNQREKNKTALDSEIKASEKILAILTKLTKSEAYQNIKSIKSFVDKYQSQLSTLTNKMIQSASIDALERTQDLRRKQEWMLYEYLNFIKLYNALSSSDTGSGCISDPKYYPAEAQRVAKANQAALLDVSHDEIIMTSARGKINTNLPQVKLSVHIDNELDALTACPDETQKAFELIFPIVEAFERSEYFQQLIETLPQAQAFLDEKADIIRNFAEKLLSICQQCHHAVININTVATTSHSPQQLKNTWHDAALNETWAILALFEPAKYHSTIDYPAISACLQNAEINKKIADFPLKIYQKLFELLLETIKTFGTIENLTSKYGSTHTAASITALTNAIYKDTAAAQTKFDEGNHAAAFQSIVSMFNGMFSTSAYLYKYLVSIATRSYTSSSTSSSYSSSSYTSSYSDYTPPPAYSDYSDYKPPYSDYSDYKDYSDYSDSYSDSSYGGGSSGGGGASGDW